MNVFINKWANSIRPYYDERANSIRPYRDDWANAICPNRDDIYLRGELNSPVHPGWGELNSPKKPIFKSSQ